MRKKIYHLSTCNTCQRVIAELGGGAGFELQDIKTDPITPAQLEELYERVGSYEALFSRRARKFRAQGLHEQQLTEADYRRLILGEYTFLNRPVIILGEEVFVGSARKNVEAIKAKIQS